MKETNRIKSTIKNGRHAAHSAAAEAAKVAKETLAAGEQCVERNALSATATAFSGGLMLGALAGWYAMRAVASRRLAAQPAAWWRRMLGMK